MKNTIIVILLILIHTTLHAKSIEVNAPVSNDTIKFLLNEHNNIKVQAILNKVDTLSLMFHTDINSISLTPDKSKKFKIDKTEKSGNATSWTGTGDVTYIENNMLSISHLKWEDITVWLDMLSGPNTDGKFGPNLFADKVIELNYDQNIIVLHNTEHLKINPSEFLSFNLKPNEYNSLIVQGTMKSKGRVVKHDFILHSGYGGTIILDDKIRKSNEIFNQLPVIDKNVLKDSFGNDILTKKVLLDHFELFNQEFNKLPISYFESDLEIQKTSVIGGAMLKRFNMFIDLSKSQIHVSKNKNTDIPFKDTP